MAEKVRGGVLKWLAGALVFLLLAAVAGLQVLRLSDERHATAAWNRLAQTAPAVPAPFDPAMVETLPEPARRYFLHTIAPGTAIRTVAEIDMTGALGLGNRDDPRYLPMNARQILAAPQGFVWRVHAGTGLMRMSGSDGYEDGQGWTRFWLLGVLPVVRAGGTEDFARSAAARGIAEALFWTPGAMLPREGVSWTPVDDDTARLNVDHRGERFAVDLTVDGDGRPLSVTMQRWTNANPEGEWRFQPFGGTIEEVGRFDGYTVAVRVDGGNFFGTDDYFPFYRARVTGLRFR